LAGASHVALLQENRRNPRAQQAENRAKALRLRKTP